MSHQVAIVAHDDRLERAHELSDKTNAAIIIRDAGRVGPGKNHLRAWRYLYRHCTGEWLVVLEDDALPVPQFSDQLAAALKVAPAPVIGLYLGRTRPGYHQPRLARVFGEINIVEDLDPHFLTGLGILNCVGLAIKRSLVPSMDNYVRWHLRTRPIDEAMDRWTQRMKIKVAYTHPSLVDHNDQIPSVIKERTSMLGTMMGWDSPDRTGEIRRAWRVGTRPEWQDIRLRVPPPLAADVRPEVFVTR